MVARGIQNFNLLLSHKTLFLSSITQNEFYFEPEWSFALVILHWACEGQCEPTGVIVLSLLPKFKDKELFELFLKVQFIVFDETYREH